MKVTDPDYFLPLVQAFEAGAVFETGANKPSLVRGVCLKTGVKSDYVVKFRAAERMSNEAYIRELVAAFIAMELDLLVAEPAVINISEDLIGTMKGNKNYSLAEKSIGYNFGTKYKEGFQDLVEGQKIPDELSVKIKELFAFDLFISNADRTKQKPNSQTNGKELFILDHELAFGFTMELPFARNKTPWLIREQEMEWIKQNWCYHVLKGKPWDFSNFMTRLLIINDSFWSKLEAHLPSEFGKPDLELIKAYLKSIIENRNVFEQELNRILV